MKNRIKKTNKDYVVIVNHPELQKRAEELGYQEVNYIPLENLTEAEDDVLEEELIRLKKHVVVFYFRSEEEEEDLGTFYYWWISPDSLVIEYHLLGWEINERETVINLEGAIRAFPLMDAVEKDLLEHGKLFVSDYEGRCGNCHEIMDENDKYCKRCGTKRGEGKFLPYQNTVCYLYGAPLKKKYKCSSCGHIWIVNAAGWKDSLYCPQCGKEQPTVIKEHVCWEFFLGDPLSKEEPYDEDSRPILLSEENVKALLDRRDKHQVKHSFDTPSNVLKTMKAAGMSVPDSTWDEEKEKYIYPNTEAEHEQILQAYRVLQTKGSNLNGCHEVICPYCHSNMIAALAYTVKSKIFHIHDDDYHIPTEEDALTFHARRSWFPDEDKDSRSAYLCLCCGTEFGKLKWRPEDQQ